MKKLFLLLLLALAPSLAPAASFAATFGPTEKLGPGQILRGRFTQEHPIQGGAKRIKSVGHFIIDPARGVLWAVEKPLPLSVVITPQGMVQSVGGLPVMRLTPAQAPFITDATDLLTAALGGDFKKLSERFTITNSGIAKSWKVKLTPKDVGHQTAMPFVNVTAAGGRYVNSADVLRSDGLSDRFDFTDQSITRGPLGDDEALFFDAATAQRP